MDLSQRATLALLSVRVGWLLLKLQRINESADLFAEAHAALLRVVGRHTPAGFLAAPGLVRVLYATGRCAVKIVIGGIVGRC